MQPFLPSQSVDSLRFDLSSGALNITFGPGTTVSSIALTPTAIVWS